MNYKVNIEINKKDLILGQLMIGIKSLFINILFIIFSLLVAYQETYIEGQTKHKVLVFIVLASISYIFMHLLVVIILILKCILGHKKNKICSCELSFDENTMTKTSKYIKSEYSYKTMTKVLVFLNTMYISVCPGQYHMAPKRCFNNNDDFVKLYEFLKTKVRNNRDRGKE